MIVVIDVILAIVIVIISVKAHQVGGQGPRGGRPRDKRPTRNGRNLSENGSKTAPFWTGQL